MANKATLTNRGALYASVSVNGKEHFVGCTHLTANLIVSAPYANDPPYTKGDIVVYKREVYTITHIEEDTFVTLTSATGTVETITSAISTL